MALLVVDGPDRVGKGTFIKRFCELAVRDWPFPIVVQNKAPPVSLPLKSRRAWAMDQYLWQYKDAKKRGPCALTVIDRAHYSEIVYGDLYRGEKSDLNYITWWERQFLKATEGMRIMAAILEDNPLEILARDDGLSTYSDCRKMIYRELEYFHRLKLVTHFPSTLRPTPESVLHGFRNQLEW